MVYIGCDRLRWGSFWVAGLGELGADIGVASESRVIKDAKYARACHGMRNAEHVSVRHSVPTGNCRLAADDADGCTAGGVSDCCSVACTGSCCL